MRRLLQISTVFCLAATALLMFDAMTYSPRVCLKYSRVKQISSVEHRSVTLELENGQKVVVHQPVVHPGDFWCVSRGSVNEHQ